MGGAITPCIMVVMMAAMGIQTSERSLPHIKFQHQVVLDQRGTFIMMWTPTQDNIRVEIQVATKGWVGLGFSPNGGMGGADITLGWVDLLGDLHVHDRYAYGMTIPVVDTSQDLVVEGGYQNDTHTVIRFSRPWNTCDKKHDFKLSSDTIRVIWAYGEEDPIGEMMMERHVERGTKSIYLKEPRFTLPTFTEDVKTLDIRAPNVSLTNETHTVYWCKMSKMPTFKNKVHVIGFQPLITPAHIPYVHHILIYSCSESHAHLDKWTHHDGVQCWSPNMPPSWSSCKTTYVVWAVGSEGEMWPENVGVPLGAGSGISYILIEIHYDLQRLTNSIVDDSGIRLFYTEKLRRYDAGILSIGHTVSPYLIVPPRQIWKTIGHCSDTCTNSAFPADGIKVFQVFLHAHILGRGLTVRHIRGDRELPIISQDLNYDFNYQQGRLLEEEVTVLPGDTLTVECDYDSTNRGVPTFGGESTVEEMCLAFLMYSPKVSMSQCRSNPTLENIYKPLGFEKSNTKSAPPLYYNSFDLERERIIAEALLERNEKPRIKELDVSSMFKKVILVDPVVKKNKTFYDVLFDENTWRDERKLKDLQTQIEYNTHNAVCKFGHLGKGLKKHDFHYPEFITINTIDEECTTQTHESQAYFPVHKEPEKTIPVSLAIQPTFTLHFVITPLLLVIFSYQ